MTNIAAQSFRSWRKALLFGVPLALLAGCQNGFEEGPSGPVALGNNLVGESCRLEERRTPLGLGESNSYNIYCGQWERASAHLAVVESTETSASALDQVAAESAWRRRLDGLARCDGAESTTTVADAPARLLNCKLENGGWPYMGLAAGLGGDLYLVDGIHSSLPAVEQAVGVLSGTTPETMAAAGRRSDALQSIESQLGNRLFGAGDLEDYQLLLRAGYYFNGRKDFAQAETRYREALEIHQRVLGEDNPDRGEVLMHLALEISNQERFAVAEAQFDRAGALVQRAADPAVIARYWSYRAIHELNQGNYDRGIELAERATEMRRQIATEIGMPAFGSESFIGTAGAQSSAYADFNVLSLPSNHAAVDVAHSLSLEAAAYESRGESSVAQAKAEEAFSVLQSASNTPEWWQPQVQELRGLISASLGEYGRSEALLRDALAQRQVIAPRSRPHALAYLHLADVLNEAGEPGPALEAYRNAARILKEEEEVLRMDQAEPYLSLLSERMAAGGGEELQKEVVNAAELVRSPIAAQNISEASARLAASDKEVGRLIRELQDARRRRDSLLFNFNWLSLKATTPEDERALEKLRADIAGLEEEISRLEPQVQAAAPNLNMLQGRPVGAEKIMGLMRPGEALATFLFGEDAGYSILVTSEGVQMHRNPLSQERLRVLVSRLREAFSVEQVGGRLRIGGFDVVASHLLYRALLGPFDSTLDNVDHLIAVPTDSLLNLPLGVLVREETPARRNADYSDVPWLIKDMAISISPSVRAFVDLRDVARPSQASSPFLGYGDFQPVGDADIIMRTNDLPEACRAGAEAAANAPPLQRTATQVQQMARNLGASPGSVVLGEAFNEQELRERSLDDYRILAFATHGLLPGELDCLSEPSLLVSRPGDAPAGDDGLLGYSEIFDLELDADLVVLSACNTGGPIAQGASVLSDRSNIQVTVDQGETDRQRGESLAGLARAFFYAGARSLLVTHWYVEDTATMQLMSDMFQALSGPEKESLAEALREAQVRFIDNPRSSHPYLWAGFTLVGDGNREIGS